MAAITESSWRGQPVRVWEVIHDADELHRDIPSFDDLSYGLARFEAAGYVAIERDDRGDVVLRSTAEGRRLRRRADKMRDSPTAVHGMIVALHEAGYPGAVLRHRHLGRLAGFEEDDYERAYREYHAWFSKASRPLLATMLRWEKVGRWWGSITGRSRRG